MSIKIKANFFNRLAQELDKTYFPEVKYYMDNKNTTVIPIEKFSPGIYFVTVENENYSKVYKLKVQ